MGWLWMVIFGVVVAALLIAFLVDRRGGTGTGMTNRHRNEASRALRDQGNRAMPWNGDTSMSN